MLIVIYQQKLQGGYNLVVDLESNTIVHDDSDRGNEITELFLQMASIVRATAQEYNKGSMWRYP